MEKSSPPDLLIIDGAYTHLKSVRSELDKMNLSSIKLLSISKGSRRKEQFDSLTKENGDIIKVNRTSKTHLLIQEIRNESHRFSIQSQRKIHALPLRVSPTVALCTIVSEKTLHELHALPLRVSPTAHSTHLQSTHLSPPTALYKGCTAR